MRTALSTSFVIAILLALVPELPAQEEGAAQRIRRRIEEGAGKLAEEVREAWTEVRKRVDELGVQGRVYGRLRWDKALADDPINVDVEKKFTDDESTVILTGRVPDEHAREKALQLARDTVGVREVVDRLQVAPRPRTQEPASNGRASAAEPET
jgi:osmotically-inducible protein OsmY